jgi:hypothetical protein
MTAACEISNVGLWTITGLDQLPLLGLVLFSILCSETWNRVGVGREDSELVLG